MWDIIGKKKETNGYWKNLEQLCPVWGSATGANGVSSPCYTRERQTSDSTQGLFSVAVGCSSCRPHRLRQRIDNPVSKTGKQEWVQSQIAGVW